MTPPIPANPAPVQALSRVSVWVPALVDQAYDYLAPAGTPVGAVVEVNFAGRKLVGLVANEEVPPPGGGCFGGGRSGQQPTNEGQTHPAPTPTLPLRGREPSSLATKLKPLTRVIDHVPPLPQEYLDWLQFVAEFTLAPIGAVVGLCGLAHAAKPPGRKAFVPPSFALNLPELNPAQAAVLAEMVRLGFVQIPPPGGGRLGGGHSGQSRCPERPHPNPPPLGEGAFPHLPILLDGVTGSGKTEVYFHWMAQRLGFGGETKSNSGVRSARATPRVVPPPEGGRLGGGRSGQQPTNEGQTHPAPTPTLPLRGREPSSLATGDWRLATPPQLLILLPEITLTHQWLARFEAAFGFAPLVWHSRMTPAAKARAWKAIADGTAPVVVGARSALFLPFANLTAIIVDEEHDASYKQEDGVLYHARDMAVARARMAGIPILLASATPSLETLENVRRGKYRALTLTSRFGTAQLPEVSLVDLRNAAPERGNFLSPVVIRAALETLARGEQVLFFLNRRGYAPLLLCRTCSHRFECSNCSSYMVVHGSVGGRIQDSGFREVRPSLNPESRTPNPTLACHHCGTRAPMPKACPACGADHSQLVPCGPGVERIAQEVGEVLGAVTSEQESSSGARSPQGEPLAARGLGAMPPSRAQPRIVTLSSDTAIPPETWAAIEAGEIDILVGTQMVAKGHHFPRLTLVVVVDADVGLSGADLRGGERTYQMLHQLGGRAGRGDLPGRVLIQTYEPNHPVMQSLIAHDRDRLMALEAEERRVGGWPPFGQLAAILLDGVDEAKVRAAGQALAQSAPNDPRLTVLGPAPAALSRLKGQFRYRLLIKAKPGIHLQRTLRGWILEQKFPGVRIKVDVNPYYFL